jgi:NhaP-type Na+/H+ or K+/H+ antiporter
MPRALADPGLTIALALVSGVAAQLAARALGVPSIVLLLAAGVLLGPDGANLVRPGELGAALPIIVSFGVAVILFEGALSLDVRRLRREVSAVRRLVLIGGLVTAVGAAAVAHRVMDWPWRLAVVFGALVCVTGPTVVQPLLRRVQVHHRLQTILEAEGIFLDAIGAILTVVALKVPPALTAEEVRDVVTGLVRPLGAGIVLGALGAAVIIYIRRSRHVPEDLENVTSLVCVLMLFQGADMLVPESGIATVVVAGLLVGNFAGREMGALVAFKGQLTVLLLSLLFVLLAADVRVGTVVALGFPGLLTVVLLMFLVRPLSVLVSTLRTRLERRDRLFMSWLAPRGIVAVAVSSIAAQELARHGEPLAASLRALVFLVIAVTVVVQGLGARPIAHALGVERHGPAGDERRGERAVRPRRRQRGATRIAGWRRTAGRPRGTHRAPRRPRAGRPRSRIMDSPTVSKEHTDEP